jgi:hypothetical protein
MPKEAIKIRNLRDYIAAAALQGMLSAGGINGHMDGGGENSDPKNHATWAYEYADEMLKAREIKEIK